MMKTRSRYAERTIVGAVVVDVLRSSWWVKDAREAALEELELVLELFVAQLGGVHRHKFLTFSHDAILVQIECWRDQLILEKFIVVYFEMRFLRRNGFGRLAVSVSELARLLGDSPHLLTSTCISARSWTRFLACSEVSQSEIRNIQFLSSVLLFLLQPCLFLPNVVFELLNELVCRVVSSIRASFSFLAHLARAVPADALLIAWLAFVTVGAS